MLVGPLADRIDLMVQVPPLTLAGIDEDVAGETSVVVRARVLAARAFRAERERGGPSLADVGHCHPALLEKRLGMSPEARQLLRDALVRHGLGGRGYVRVLAVSRTIADLEQSARITQEHVAEALAFRLQVPSGMTT